jgi:hypothetical protein
MVHVVMGGRRHQLVSAVNGTGRGENQVFDPSLPAALDYMSEPNHIGLDGREVGI